MQDTINGYIEAKGIYLRNEIASLMKGKRDFKYFGKAHILSFLCKALECTPNDVFKFCVKDDNYD